MGPIIMANMVPSLAIIIITVHETETRNPSAKLPMGVKLTLIETATPLMEMIRDVSLLVSQATIHLADDSTGRECLGFTLFLLLIIKQNILFYLP